MWTLAAALSLAGAGSATAMDMPASAPAQMQLLPAKTALKFHLTEPLSSDQSKTGQLFSFVMLDPIQVDGRTLVASGAVGAGTLLLAGHAGTSGHEGDLTLRIDSIPTVDGRKIVFDNQQIRINGRNKKVIAGLLGFIPYAGIGARLIRGADIQIDTATPIQTVLERNAAIVDVVPPAPVAPSPASDAPASVSTPVSAGSPAP